MQAGLVFRVEILELSKFLAGLAPNQLVKASFTCKWEVYTKIDRLLQEQGLPGLGFERGLTPDGDWLYKVARWVDPFNVCCLFRVALRQITKGDTDSYRIELGKRAIEHDMLITSRLDEVEEVRAAVEELQLCHQRFSSRNAELNHLMV